MFYRYKIVNVPSIIPMCILSLQNMPVDLVNLSAFLPCWSLSALARGRQSKYFLFLCYTVQIAQPMLSQCAVSTFSSSLIKHVG